ncbi:MAG: hypothetical protein JKY65_13870 [Planctomycetes bacterium]|nr:hypothetical protein [Planctomycetota bacterium]
MKKAQGPGFKAPEPREDVRVKANRCPFCRDEVLAEESVACQGCLTRHHLPCWEEGAGCSACRGTSLLEPRAATPERLREPGPRLPTKWRQADGRIAFSAWFKGRQLLAVENPKFTELVLSAGDTVLAKDTRSLFASIVDALRTWLGATPTWEIEGTLVIDGNEHQVKAIHHVTLTRHYVQIHVDGDLIGPEIATEIAPAPTA